MPTPSQQLLSRTIYDVDGTTTVWNFAFSGGYIDPSHVKAYTELPNGIRTPIAVTPEMLIGEFQLLVTPALPPSAGLLVIYRDTPKDLPLVDFVEGPLSEVALDTNARQAVFIAAEAQDEFASTNYQVAVDAASASVASAAQTNIDASTAASAASAAGSSALIATNAAASAANAAASAANAAASAVDAFVSGLAAAPGAALVGFQQSGAGAVARTVAAALNSGVIYVQRAGAVGDGLADDTAIATAVHVYANSIGAAVSYAGMDKIALQANAAIPIKTSTDFAGCELVILGGVVGSPSFSTFNELFVVSDDACPLVTVTGAVTSTNLTKSALFPTLGLFDGHGFARLECAYQVPNREKTGTVNYQQAFKVNRNGRCSQPLSVDLSAHAAAITVRYRKTSKKRLNISNVALTEGAWNNQRVFHIDRCNVAIENFSVMFDAAGTFNNICELISVEDASDIHIVDFVTTGRPVTLSTGSYCLAVNGGADIFIDGMNALTGWGATGCNYISGVYFDKCVLNRVDAHQSGHNVFVTNSDLHEAGMVYGWGGGVLSVKNSRLHRCAAISNRPDYGNTFFGDLVVADCEAESNITSTYRLIDLETNPLGASTPVFAPTSITVNNVKRVGRATGSNAEFIPVAVKVRGATDVVYAPTHIGVSGVDCFPSWRFGLRVDTMNMEANPAQPICRIVFDNARPDSVATSTTGVLDFASIRTPTARVRPWIRGSDCENIFVQNMAPANLEIDLSNVSVNGVVVDTAAAAQPTVTLTGCKLKNPAYTNAPIGGTSSGTSGYTTLIACEVAAVQFELSLISAAIGTTVRSGAVAPTLPAGVTISDLFTGWRKAGAFA